MNTNNKTAVILCGGQGFRIKEHFNNVPKPLIPIGDKPLLSYIIDGYKKHGIHNFILLVGNYEDHFLKFANTYSNTTTQIIVLQTGENTPSGGRIKKAEVLLIEHEYFFLTYGDGIADIDFQEQNDFHQTHGKTVTVTAVRPYLPFGFLELGKNNEVTSFIEKPISTQFINGGFFLVNKEIFHLLTENSDFEKETLKKLATIHQLMAYKHNRFWQNMDTYKDYLLLNARLQ